MERDKEIFIRSAASLRLDDSLQAKDNVFDHLYRTNTTSETLKDVLKIIVDHENLLRQQCQQLEYLLLDEYYFHSNKNIKVRSSLRNMFVYTHACFPLITVPYGISKSLIGVTVAFTMNKRFLLVFYNSNVSDQNLVNIC
ncbi:unnamed protein product [Rotaria sp. Silwood2]|nr:unnamed protein product [Rotaria sp. Silwood2]CAF4518077.1 unnamed protein product [Rotaria sp. Silwood2]